MNPATMADNVRGSVRDPLVERNIIEVVSKRRGGVSRGRISLDERIRLHQVGNAATLPPDIYSERRRAKSALGRDQKSERERTV